MKAWLSKDLKKIEWSKKGRIGKTTQSLKEIVGIIFGPFSVTFEGFRNSKLKEKL